MIAFYVPGSGGTALNTKATWWNLLSVNAHLASRVMGSQDRKEQVEAVSAPGPHESHPPKAAPHPVGTTEKPTNGLERHRGCGFSHFPTVFPSSHWVDVKDRVLDTDSGLPWSLIIFLIPIRASPWSPLMDDVMTLGPGSRKYPSGLCWKQGFNKSHENTGTCHSKFLGPQCSAVELPN